MDEVTGALLGIGLNQAGNMLQMGQQQNMMQQQYHNQMALNQQMQSIQQQNWDYTNYENQVKHMKNAGLNVGLMYSGGGGGGQSMGGASGGSASMGNAPQAQNYLGLMQADVLRTQANLNEAEANKANALADKTKGVDTANTVADTNLKDMMTANSQLQLNLQQRSLEDTLDTIKANRDKAVAESVKSMTEADVDLTTKQAKIDKINAEANNEAFKLILMKADRNLKVEQARAITVELAQEWERLSIEVDKVGVAKMHNAIQEFTAKVNAKLGQGNLQMRQIEAGIEGMGKLLYKGVNINQSGPRNTTIHKY